MVNSLRSTFALTAIVAAVNAFAALELGAPFTDGAVLQQGAPLRVWGRADAGSTVTVEFGGKSFSTTAGTDGAWRPFRSSTPATTSDGPRYFCPSP